MLVANFNSVSGMNINISPFLRPENIPEILNGVNPSYVLGALTKDLGYSQVGDTIETGKSVTGLFDFHQNPTTQKELATINNAAGTNLVLAYNNSGTWTDIALTNAWDTFEDAYVNMEAFIGYCFFVGYDDTDDVFLPVGSLTGTTFSVADRVTNMPQAKYIRRYRDRLYLAHCRSAGTTYEYRIYFSSVPSAGDISWTVASDFLDVDYGEQITGLGSNFDRLVIFTENSAYHYDQSSFKKVWQVGCANHRTIQNHGQYMLWADYDGVWLTTGGQPKNISGPVIDFIRNGDPREFFSCVVDEEYRMYVGTVTVNSVTYANCELVFNIPTNAWRIREYHDNFTVYATYNDSGKIRQHMGDDSGEVMNKGKYTDATLVSADDGNAIVCTFELAPIHMGSFDRFKSIKRLVAYAKKAQGLNLKFRILDKNTAALMPYQKLGELTKYMNTFDIGGDNGVFIQIAGTEYGSKEYFEFYGYAIDIEQYSRTYASNQKSA